MSPSILRSTEYVKRNRCRIKFHTHHNPFTDDKQYAYSPELNTNGEVRVYTVMGKTNLNDAAWVCPTNAANRRDGVIAPYQVKVEMP